MFAERLAFDTSRYVTPDGFNSNAWIEDLGGLSLEAGTHRPLHKRINTFTIEEVENGKVINRIFGDRDVSTYYSENTDTEKKERSAGIQMRDLMLSEPAGTMTVWISPAGGEHNYEEGRIVVAISDEMDNFKRAQSFGISVKFSAHETLMQFNTLSRYSTSIHLPAFSAEQIRDQVLVFHPSNKPHFEILRENIPLDKVWNEIESGNVFAEKEAATSDSKKVWGKVGYMFENAKTREDFIRAGAAAESEMANLGRRMSGGPCGELNSKLLSKMNNPLWTHVELSKNPIEENGEEGEYFECPRCEGKIKSGQGITTCPHCGLTKEQAGNPCPD